MEAEIMNYVLFCNNAIAEKLNKNGFKVNKRISFDVNEFNRDNVVSVYKFKNNYSGEIIIIPSFVSDDVDIETVYVQLIQMGFERNKILFIPIEIIFGEEEVNIEKFYKHGDITYLDYLEISINDNCNMNCKGCSHFANLSPRKNKDFKSFERDFKKLKTLIPHIFKIRIMGGEPFLNPQLKKYIEMIKEIYPYTDLRVVTNGILLNTIDEQMVELLKKENIMLDISVYPPMQSKIDEIVEELKSKELKIFLENITSFKPILLKEKQIFPYKNLDNCLCINLQDGMLAPCPLPFTIDYYNDKFNGEYRFKVHAINIYEVGLTGAKIKEKLVHPFELCNYCAHYRNDLPFFKWEQRATNPRPDDWTYTEGRK